MNTIIEKAKEQKRTQVQFLNTLKVKTDGIANFLELATQPLAPMQVKRRIVTFRTLINRIMRTPQHVENVELRPLTVETDFEVPTLYCIETREIVETSVQTYTSKLGGVINTRIETYKNKQVVRVFANIDEEFLKRKNFVD